MKINQKITLSNKYKAKVNLELYKNHGLIATEFYQITSLKEATILFKKVIPEKMKRAEREDLVLNICFETETKE